MIQGPPGTGKTETAAAIAEVNRSGTSFSCACAPSNNGIDELGKRMLANDVEIVRFGDFRKVSPHLLELMLDRSVEYAVHNEATSTYTFKGKGWKKAKKRIYERMCEKPAIIHIGTLDSAGTGPVLQDTLYAFVLIDEAGQATEPQSWPVAVRTLRLCLCGDQQQLPPCSESCLLGTSLLERLSACTGFETVMLLVQYRMLPEIIAWPNKYFYRDLLQSFQKPCKEDDLIIGFDWPQGLPMAFVQVDGAEKSRDGSARPPASKSVAMRATKSDRFCNLLRACVQKLSFLDFLPPPPPPPTAARRRAPLPQRCGAPPHTSLPRPPSVNFEVPPKNALFENEIGAI